MASASEYENYALYHDPQDQNRSPFQFVHQGLHHELPVNEMAIFS